jgi:hypothetical protein
MGVHCAASVINVRVFHDDSVDIGRPAYELHEPYDAYLTVSSGMARIEGLSFKFSKSQFNELFEKLHAFGARLAAWRHNNTEVIYDIKTRKRIKNV